MENPFLTRATLLDEPRSGNHSKRSFNTTTSVDSLLSSRRNPFESRGQLLRGKQNRKHFTNHLDVNSVTQPYYGHNRLPRAFCEHSGHRNTSYSNWSERIHQSAKCIISSDSLAKEFKKDKETELSHRYISVCGVEALRYKSQNQMAAISPQEVNTVQIPQKGQIAAPRKCEYYQNNMPESPSTLRKKQISNKQQRWKQNIRKTRNIYFSDSIEVYDNGKEQNNKIRRMNSQDYEQGDQQTDKSDASCPIEDVTSTFPAFSKEQSARINRKVLTFNAISQADQSLCESPEVIQYYKTTAQTKKDQVKARKMSNRYQQHLEDFNQIPGAAQTNSFFQNSNTNENMFRSSANRNPYESYASGFSKNHKISMSIFSNISQRSSGSYRRLNKGSDGIRETFGSGDAGYPPKLQYYGMEYVLLDVL